MTSSPTPGLPQQIGRYQIGRVLGRGGFATVLKAFDEGLRSDVAIKVLDASYADDADISERFVNEGQLLRRVDHPNVVSVHDVGKLEDGRPFYVMSYAPGGVLSERLPNGPGLVGPDDLLRIVEQLAGGLNALHEAGVVHRDMKPGNLLIGGQQQASQTEATGVRRGLLGPEERVMVCDLGFAKVLERTSIGEQGVQPTVLGGSAFFRAPEQSQLGAEITPATDVYGASGVLWNLLTGAPPPQTNEVETASVGIPAQWRDFFARGLAQRPDDRFPTMAKWAQAARDASPAASTVGFAPAVAGAICPFKGLAAFQPEDAQFFFGRERLVDELIGKLQAHSTLVISGASGSGKSSLMRAGLLAALAKGALPGSQSWKTILFSPGRDPLRQLHRQFAQIPEPSETIGTGVVVAIDQFEEVFTGSGDPAEFIAEVEDLAQDHQGRVRVIISVRADFYGECSHHQWLADAINRNSVLVGPLSRSELRAAVEGPARKAGLGLEAGLVDMILEQAPDDAGALPLIAHALMETWLRRRNDQLTVNGLEAAGGVGGAIAQSADHTYEGLEPAQREMMQTLLLELVNPGDNSPDTRRLVPMDAIRGRPELLDLTERLAAARLLTLDASTAQLAHEALIDTWPRLRTWIDEARDDLRLRERIERASAAWLSEGENPDLLYRGSALAAAVHTAGSTRFSESQQRFLDVSIAAETAELEIEAAEEHKRHVLRRRVIMGLSVLTALALAASVVAFFGLERARDNEEAATRFALGLMAGQSRSLKDSDPLTSLLLAAESVARADETSQDSQRAVVESRFAVADSIVVPVGTPASIAAGKTLAMSPDGNLLAVGSRDGTVTMLRVSDRQVVGTADPHAKGVEAATFSPDSTMLATGDDDGVIWLWDAAQAPEGGRLATRGSTPVLNARSPVWGIAISSDGRHLLASTEDGRLLEVDLASPGSEPRTIWSTTEDLISLALSPDDQSVAVGSGRGTTRLLDRGSGNLVFETSVHSSDVWQVEFASGGSQLLSVSAATVSQNVVDGSVAGTVFRAAADDPNGVWIKGIAVLDDGLILGGAADGTLWVGSLPETTGTFESIAALALPVGHDDSVRDNGLVTSANRKLMASLSDQGTLRVWSATEDTPPQIATVGHDVFGAAQDSSGARVALGGDDGTVTVIDVASGDSMRLEGHVGRVFGVAYMDDLITGDSEGTLRLWNESGGLLKTVEAHPSAISAVAVSKTEGWAVSAGEDGSIKFWDRQLISTSDSLASIAGGATSVAIPPGGDFVAVSGRAGLVGFWNRDGSEKRRPIRLDDNTLWDLAFSPDGQYLATASADEVVEVWLVSDLLDSDQPQPIQVLSPQSRGASAVRFGQTSDLLYTADRNGGVRLWNPIEGKSLSPVLHLFDGDVWGLATSPLAESAIASGPGGGVFLIDLLNLDRACELTNLAADQELLDTYLSGESRTACPA